MCPHSVPLKPIASDRDFQAQFAGFRRLRSAVLDQGTKGLRGIALQTPGEKEILQSHRAEVSGHYAIMTALELIEQMMKNEAPPTGKIKVVCDNETSLSVTTVGRTNLSIQLTTVITREQVHVQLQLLPQAMFLMPQRVPLQLLHPAPVQVINKCDFCCITNIYT